MNGQPEQGWVIAERRRDGRVVPLFVVGDALEAQELARVLRRRDREVIAVEIGSAIADSFSI
jgi:hypothetical protein